MISSRNFVRTSPGIARTTRRSLTECQQFSRRQVLPRSLRGKRASGLWGKWAMFEGTQGIKIEEITDGTSNTVLLAVAAEAIPWTKPGELPFWKESRSRLWMVPTERILTGGCRRLRPLATKGRGASVAPSDHSRRGEVIVWPSRPGQARRTTVTATTEVPTTPPDYLPTASQATPAPVTTPVQVTPAATHGPTSPLSLEQRMQRVEEKLDRLLEKLDRQIPGGSSSSRP